MRRRAQGDAAAKIAVSAQIFRAAVHHYVHAQLQGRLVHRRGERIVYDAHHPALPRDRSHAADVNHVEQRIGRGFDDDELRGAGKRRLDRARVRRHKRIPDTEPLEHVGDEGMRSAIKLILQDDVIPAAGEGEDRRADRRHSRTEQHAVLGPFEGAELLHDRLLIGGVEVARIDVVLPVEVLERGGGIDRCVDAAGRGINDRATMHALGVQ